MTDILLAEQSWPFTLALAIVGGLFILEILSLILGSTILGLGGGDVDVDIDADFDLSADIDSEFDIADLDIDAAAEGTDAPSGVLGWLGARDVPFLIWLISFLTMFGLFGLLVQSIANGLIGTSLPLTVAVACAAPLALGVTRVIANWVALLMPKTETSAIRTRFLGGYRGVITQGIAARDKPAEIKIKDRHDNIHYLRVEPLEDDATFPQGSEVTLIRKRGDKFFVI